MTKKTTILILIISSLLLGSWLTYYFSDKNVIKRQLGQLATEISKDGQESPIQMGIKMGRVKNRLVNPCQVIIPERNTMQPLEQDSIIRYLIYYRQRYAQLSMTFTNIDIHLVKKTEATVQTTLHLLSQTQPNQENIINEMHAIEFHLVKNDKTWQIMQVTVPVSLIE